MTSRNEECAAYARQKRRHILAGAILGIMCLGSLAAATLLLIPNGTHVSLPEAEERRLIIGVLFSITGILFGIGAFFSLTGVEFESN